jgi:hypothetical protein
MTEDECLEGFGVRPAESELPAIRKILADEVEKERESQGLGDTELMRLCCVQLFSAGRTDDVLVIWGAKTASMDADASIEIALLCGAGVEETKTYLSGLASDEAAAALEALRSAEEAGELEEFSPGDQLASYEQYYGGS